ncbi:MAG: type II toxin-antitoxin system RelE/ParE family toxin [Chloroflexi bacterium]|nr:type II toxin-antitoxin system RelE/ParE family toxin [Chloroflexota bacterium]
MRVEYTPAFARDLKRERNAELKRRVERRIEELKAATAITDVTRAVRVTAPGRYYRIRLGDFRLGFALVGDRVVLLRFMHRRDIYRYFP